MKKLYTLFVVMLLVVRVVGQGSMSVQTVTPNSVTIEYSLDAEKSLHLFKDTMIFYEDFANFPITSSYDIARTGIPVNLPNSYTKYPGCEGRYLLHTEGNGIEFNPISSSSMPSEFISPKLNLVGGYTIKVSIEKISGSLKFMVDEIVGENVTNIINKSATGEYTYTSASGENNTTFRFYTYKVHRLKEVSVYSTPNNLQNENLSIGENQTITLTSLEPNTKYCIGIEGVDTLSFTTPNEVFISSISDIYTDKAKINVTNNVSNNTKLLVVKKEATLADDLFISEVSQTSDGRVIELYNGTGKNISLNEYSLQVFDRGNASTDAVVVRNLSLYDEVLEPNESIVVMYNLPNFKQENDARFIYVPFVDIALNGNDAILLMHNNDTIDIYGNIYEGVSVSSTTGGWHTDGISTAATVLRRNSSVNRGVKHNPNTGFPTLSTEWTQIGNANADIESNFVDFGKHTMTGALTKTDIEDMTIGTQVNATNINSTSDGYDVDGLETNNIYVAYLLSEDESVLYDYKTFRTRNIVRRTNSGEWNDSNWDIDTPTQEDIVEIPADYDVEIPQDYTARCFSLTLKDDETRKATLKNNGTLNTTEPIKIENFIKGYENEGNASGWNLVGLPINITLSNQTEITSVMDLRTDNDEVDLYYWNESYSEDNAQGQWVNWKADNYTGNFFENGRGLLLAYKNDRTNVFVGEINNDNNYTLLNNATLSLPQEDRGWHLVANPYSFKIKVSNLTQNNCTLPSILNPLTGNYEVLTSEDYLQPYQGFMTQVTNTDNLLKINKNVSKKTATSNSDFLSFEIESDLGKDVTKIAFDELSSYGLDWQTDNHKLTGMGLIPEIFTVFNNENFAVNSIPFDEDTLLLDIRINVKKEDNYKLKYLGNNIPEFTSIGLYEKSTNTKLNEFLQDSVYAFSADEQMNEDNYYILLTKQVSDIEDNPNTQNYINITQNKETVEFSSNQAIQQIILCNAMGQILATNNNTNKITLPYKDIFIIKVATNDYQQTFKVSYF
ncbi:MAG: lamin tail domain-containing protein [Bacteroidales bacterium]|nr:lamin tail domain-containing protein [Bacteroidales bacterium]